MTCPNISFLKKKKVPIYIPSFYQVMWTSPLPSLLLLEHSVVSLKKTFFAVSFWKCLRKRCLLLGLRKFTSLSDVQKVVQVNVCSSPPKRVNGWGRTLVKCVSVDLIGSWTLTCMVRKGVWVLRAQFLYNILSMHGHIILAIVLPV